MKLEALKARDVFEDNMVEAKAKAKARGLRGQGQDQGQKIKT